MNRFKDDLGELAGRFARALDAVGSKLTNTADQHSNLREHLSTVSATERGSFRHFEETVGSALDTVAEALRGLPERNRRALRVLAQHGWYVDPECSPAEVFDFVNHLESSLDEGHSALCTHYDAQIDAIEERLAAIAPARAHLLVSAFGAHRRKDYAASVPIFLAQADGICSELTGIQLYGRRNGVPRLAARFPDIAEDAWMIDSLLVALVEPSPMSASKDERDKFAGPTLNRHAVLHGESTDYDTHLNSCRDLPPASRYTLE